MTTRLTIHAKALFTAVLLVQLVGYVEAYSRELDTLFHAAGRRHNVNPQLLRAIAIQESNLDRAAVGADGEYGLMQILPATARALGMPMDRVFDPATNIEHGAMVVRESIAVIRYNRPMIGESELVRLVLAAYNSGPDAALQGRYRRQYVDSVLRRWNQLGGGSLYYGAPEAIGPPLAELWLQDVWNTTSDGLPETGDLVELTFEAKIGRQSSGRAVLVLCMDDDQLIPQIDNIADRTRGQGIAEPTRFDGVPVGHDMWRFRVRATVGRITTDGILARIEFVAGGIAYRWPWFGVLDCAGMPARVFVLH